FTRGKEKKKFFHCKFIALQTNFHFDCSDQIAVITTLFIDNICFNESWGNAIIKRIDKRKDVVNVIQK
ncbi:hypothetical protein ACG7HM_001654, partial [Enterococcus hirae]